MRATDFPGMPLLQSLVVLQWRATRSSGKIPAFRPPEDYGDSEVDKEAFTENGSVAQHYDSLAVDEEYHSTAIPSPAVTASTSPYGPGGFGAAAAGRPSGTFYDGGRPFGKAVNRQERDASTVSLACTYILVKVAANCLG